jgi:hypothetical protein
VSDPKIKAALAAATRAFNAQDLCAAIPEELAPAIAAFLRALPSGSEHGACAIPASAGSGAWWVRSLAAAVEEAARDE